METSAVSYKCPNCGGDLTFDAQNQKFSCEWCLSVFDDTEIEKIKQSAEKEERFAEETDLYKCNSCGAEIICEHNTAASFCYYCHSPVTLAGRLTGSYRPEMLIPFKFNNEQAIAAFKAHCKKKWFLPSDFLSTSQLEKITGLYVPFWLADCDVDAQMTAEGKTVTTHHHSSYTIIHTKIFDVDRGATMTYMGIPADGSKKIEDSLMDAIEPFDYKGFKEFDMTYLAGFYCDKYDVDKMEVRQRIEQRVAGSAEEVLKNDMKRYDSISVTNKRINLNKIKWHYMMLPVWFMNYKHGGTVYSFAMNGQTGKFAGKYPLSKAKLALFTAIVSIIAAAVGYGIGGLI